MHRASRVRAKTMPNAPRPLASEVGEIATGRHFSFDALRLLYHAVLFYFCWILFGLLSLLWSIVAAILFRLMSKDHGGRLGRFMIMAGFRFYLGLLRRVGLLECDFRALDSLKGETSLIITSNHPSRIDVLLLVSRLPRIVCIMKARLWDNQFLGGGARLAGYIRNDAPMEMIKTAAREVRSGQNLLIFPEGTRSRRSSLNQFCGGFSLIASQSGAPVQTVLIENDSGFLGKGWPMFKMPQFPVVFRVRLGRRFDVPRDGARFVAELEEYYRRELQTDSGDRAPA